MEREKAKALLEEQHAKRMSKQERLEILGELWIMCDSEDWFDEDDLNYFPEEIRQEMIKQDAPSNPEDSKYDFIIQDSLKGIYLGVKNSYLEKLLNQHGIPFESIEGENEIMTKCNCCSFRTISPEEDGLGEICPVCFWMNFTEGSNRMSLDEARANFIQFGAIQKRFLKSIDPDGQEKYEK